MSKQKPNLKTGDAVFFKRAKESSDPDAKFIEFQGHGFGVFLGAIPNEIHDPTPQVLFQIMGSIGFCLFDDIVEFLGEEQGRIVLKKHEEKYNPVLTEEEKAAQMKAAFREKQPVIAQRPTKKIIGLDGKPIEVLPADSNETTH
jgi:hypothetical protein